MKLKNQNLEVSNAVLMDISIPSTITAKSVVNLLRLTSKVKQLYGEHHTAVVTIMDSYKIPLKDNGYDFTNHKKKDEIIAKLKELGDQENEIEGVSFEEEDLVAKLSIGKKMPVVMLLDELLK